MRTTVAAAVGALVAASSTLAAPSPKFAYMKDRFKSQRIPVNFNLDVSKNQYNSSAYNLTDVPAAPTAKAPHKNVWAGLSNDEAAGVIGFLHNQTDLNLTAAADAGPWDNLITTLDILTPNKTETLAFLAGNASAPERYAYATISFNTIDEPYVEDFIVGPLPVSENTTYAPYSFRSTKGSSRVRNYDADSDKTYELFTSTAQEVDDIIEALLGAPTDNWDIWGIDPLWHEDGKVISWVGFWGIPDSVFDGQTLLPQGIYMKFDITGRDPSKWEFLGWLHNYVYYPTTAAFRDAWDKGLVEMTTRNAGMNSTWIGTDRKGPELPHDDQPPPMQIAPGGQRFSVDEEEQYVEWMDFSYYWSFRRDTGVRLWDIKYKGEKIIHELGLNEALAHSRRTWTRGMFGPYSFELIAGYDCPTYAKFVNSTFHANELSTTHRNSICFFEQDVGFPMQRHTNGVYASATKNIAFTMKHVSTVGNYDYSFLYTFYLDGSIAVEVPSLIMLSTLDIQSAYYAKNGEYGYQIHDGLSGSMHDHVLNWKMDVDILGTANTVGFHTVEPKTVKYDWSPVERNTMHLVRSELKNEANGTLEWSKNGKDMVLVYNKEEKNKYGEERAWRIMPHIGGAGMFSTIQNSTNAGPSINFATSPLFVTQYHDSEFNSAHPSSAYDPFNPVIDFGKYLNDENLEQEDLVLWFNLGMHHVPHTGDLGNTVHQTAHAGMIFSPHNYLYSGPQEQSSNMVRLVYNTSSGDATVDKVLTFGGQTAMGLFNLTAIAPDYYAYQGDENTRKFPYDPLHPYDDTESIV
ncbi:hypothetical protein Rhopal_007035-T1 [Rhodotorula paludigena]|uniref:Amine oxidase n=1 Tax=Rhodotorula paludigena TaxID=86838 RepID=A0AAV5GXA2_9BASI|nr:hypothetical protein Rhopal_007035-T1 [Rhodotorula paludigena]